MLWFFEGEEEEALPPPSSSVFVMRNGRYEAQNLMPMAPQADYLDFDGFSPLRSRARLPAARPPDLRQASLVKNPVSVRRDSVHALAPKPPAATDATSFEIVFDASRPGKLTVHLLVTEVELSKEGDERSLSLRPQAPEGSDSDWHHWLGRELDSIDFEAGLGQVYQSPAIDATCVPAERLAFDPERPRDVPLAVRLEAVHAPGEEACTHFAYISLARASGSTAPSEGKISQWCPQAFAQKLQYAGNFFVLYEVFGAASHQPLADEQDGGNPDCVICLSEPRDTAVLPCRHMCFCRHCAGIVRMQCDKCPVCRQKVKSLLQFRRGRDEKTMDLLASRPEEAGAAVSARDPVVAATSSRDT